MAQALALKYRPSTFSDLVGQEAVSKTLSLALSSSKLSHAYLFSGIRGSGKTSTARIFAKALLCEHGPTNNPCQTCEHCLAANEGRHIDIIEMDAASNRGIEDIKELIEHTKYKPSTGRFKVFIIDEVHMLTVQAFNALLKTLEEPPEFVKFILATTDPLKLPATILSRTQHFRFKKLPIKVVKEHLAYILHEEKVEFENEALEIIARSGHGSLRDAITLLDQAIVYSNSNITVKATTDMLGVVDPTKIAELIKSIRNKDKNAILDFLEEFNSYEAEMIIDEITLFLQNKLLEQDGELTTLIIDRFFRALAEGKKLLSIGSSGEFVLSLTLFKMLEAMNIHSIDDMIHQLQNELGSSKQNSTPATTKKEISSSKESLESKATTFDKNLETHNSSENIVKEESTNNNKIAQNLFEELTKKIYDRNYDLGEIFENNVTFVSFLDNTLTWESTVDGEDKKTLIKNWHLLKLFVEDTFGVGTKIVNISKKKLVSDNKEKPLKKLEEQEEQDSNTKPEEATKISAQDLPKSSCIMPESTKDASIDKDPKELLEEPMIQGFIKHLSPKKVIVKQKS